MCQTLRVVFLLLLWMLGTVSVFAQAPRRAPGRPQARPGAQQRPAKLRTEGTIKAIRPGVVLVATEKNEDWLVMVPRKPEAIEYHAKASPEWLKSRMDVRFTALLDKQRRAQEQVDELTVVTLRPGVNPGLMPESTMPGQEQLSAERPRQRRVRGGGRRVLAMPFLVIGRLLGLRKGTMVVMAGPHRVEAPLAENAQVTVHLNDYRLARPGDKVEVSARYYPNQPGRAMGERLVITAAQPLGKIAKTGPPEQPADGAGPPAEQRPDQQAAEADKKS